MTHVLATTLAGVGLALLLSEVVADRLAFVLCVLATAPLALELLVLR